MKPRQRQIAPELPAAVVVAALSGFSATPLEGPSTEADRDAIFELFQSGEEGLSHLWRQHEAFLRAEARRLGIKPKDRARGRPMFFAEHAQAPWLEREYDNPFEEENDDRTDN